MANSDGAVAARRIFNRQINHAYDVTPLRCNENSSAIERSRGFAGVTLFYRRDSYLPPGPGSTTLKETPASFPLHVV